MNSLDNFTRLHTRNLSYSYGKKSILSELSVTIPDGKITALIGPNGSGKSTLLKNLARVLWPCSGSVMLDGKQIHQTSTKAVARQIALLPQGPQTPDELTVETLVGYGRYPYKSAFASLNHEDRQIITEAIETTGLSEYATCNINQLSGGQRQRAWIAMAIAQKTDILLLDEPTTFLDLSHQIEVLELLLKLNKQGATIVTVLHDLNQACRCADHLLVMNNGLIEAQGPPDDVMTEALLEDVFNVACRVIRDPVSDTPLCVPLKGF
jgi:ABC-type cobalamin/Fe3+-siderophores transport system ATPase subunit